MEDRVGTLEEVEQVEEGDQNAEEETKLLGGGIQIIWASQIFW